MATTSTKVLKVICRNRRKVRNRRNQATFNLATRWIPFYINPPRAVISPTNDPRDLLLARCFVATGGEASTRFLLDQRERWGFSGTWGRVTNILLHMMSAAYFISLFWSKNRYRGSEFEYKKNKNRVTF